MNKDQFAYFLTNPNLLNTSSVDEMNELINEFPFFQTAHLLLVKNLLSLNSIKYNKQLKISATYANDRAILFHLINDDFINKEEAKINDKEQAAAKKNNLLVFDFPVNLEQNKTSKTEKMFGFEINSSYIATPINKSEENIDTENHKNSLKHRTQNSLIDNFLNNNPKIIPKINPEGNEDISEESVKEDNELITETLVKIYIKQGYYFKAIIAYEKLSLKYPEKSIYFANQIKKIKQIINNK